MIAKNVGRISKYAAPINTLDREWRCGVYLRLSKADKNGKEVSDSIINQKSIIDKFLAKNSDLKVYDIYIDDDETGTNLERPGMVKLLNDIRSGKVNCLIVKDLSRFGRDKIEMSKFIEIEFPMLNLRVISVTEFIDSYKRPGSLNNFNVAMQTVTNDEYCRDISNKIKGVLNAKRRRGAFVGSFAPYGYMKSPENHNKLIIDEEASEVVRLIYKWFIEGISIYNICRTLKTMGILNPTEYKWSKGLKIRDNRINGSAEGLWSTATIRRILKNRIYLGDLIQRQREKISYKVEKCRTVDKDKQIARKNTHEPIITNEIFEKAQVVFQRDTWQSQQGDLNEVAAEAKVGRINKFAGFVYCADCGRAMQLRKVVQPYKTYLYYNCTSYRKWKKCTKHKIQLETVESAVLESLKKYGEMAVEMESLLEVINKSPLRKSASIRINKQIEELESLKAKDLKLINGLYPDYKDGLLTQEEYLSYKSERESRLKITDEQIAALKTQLKEEEQGINSSNDFIQSFKLYQSFTEITREMMYGLIQAIHIEEGGGIRIQFKFQDAFEQVCEYIEENKAAFEQQKLAI